MTLTRGFSSAPEPLELALFELSAPPATELQPPSTKGSAALPFAAEWDWYSCTLAPEVDGASVVEHMGVVLDAAVVPASPRHGYAARAVLQQGRRTLLSVSWGGSQPRALVETSGASAKLVVPTIRSLFPSHRVTRCDSRIDFDQADAFSLLSGAAHRVASRRGIQTRVAGDWIDKVRGRTLYVGGKSSEVQCRVYEKGKQLPEFERPDWVRSELEWRPGRGRRDVAASLPASAVWGAGRWARELCQEMTGVGVLPVEGSNWQEPDDLRARNALLKQYGGILSRWAVETGGWDTLGLLLGQEVDGGASTGF